MVITMRIFITGMPGVGKTTLALKIAEGLKDLGYKVGGFITKEIRKNGRRVGFKIITLDTNDSVSSPSPPKRLDCILEILNFSKIP